MYWRGEVHWCVEQDKLWQTVKSMAENGAERYASVYRGTSHSVAHGGERSRESCGEVGWRGKGTEVCQAVKRVGGRNAAFTQKSPKHHGEGGETGKLGRDGSRGAGRSPVTATVTWNASNADFELFVFKENNIWEGRKE